MICGKKERMLSIPESKRGGMDGRRGKKERKKESFRESRIEGLREDFEGRNTGVSNS